MERRDLGRLGRALWGAGIAWMLTLLALSLYLPYHRAEASPASGVIPAYAGLYLDNRPTKFFFAAFFLLGSVSAYLVSRSKRTRRLNGPAAWLGVIVFVPIASRYTAHVFARQPSGWTALSAWACLALPVAVAAIFAPFRNRQSFGCSDLEPVGSLSVATKTDGRHGRWPGIALDLLAAVLIGVVLLPSSVGAAASRVGLNWHPVVYFIGPALYGYGHRLAPGVDYYSQYGTAPGYLFAFLLREQAEATVENYVWLCVALCGFFFFTLYLVLRRPLGRGWSLGLVLFTLILLFATNAAFLCPSSWVLRFPLLPTFIGLLAHAVRRSEDQRAVVWVGVCAGLSIFWNTETGLSMICAGGLVLLVHDLYSARRMRGPLVFAGIALLTVMVTSTLAYQEKAWSALFIRGMLRPLWVYGGGFGGIPLDWDLGWNRIYAVAFPLLGTATVGWGLAELATGERARRVVAAVPLLFALMGLCFLVKWVNRSYQVVWLQNAVPLLVVAGWWLRRACQAVDASGVPGLRRWLAAGLAGACALLAGTYLCSVKDPRFDQPLAARAFWEHPSIARALITREHPDGWPAGLGNVSTTDVALIRRLTRPDEQVALISPDDWVYLLAAHRAPKLEIVPGALLFLNREVNRSFAGVDRLFVERDVDGATRLPPDWQWTFPIWTYASALIERDFELETVGDRLAVYRRRGSGDGHPR